MDGAQLGGSCHYDLWISGDSIDHGTRCRLHGQWSIVVRCGDNVGVTTVWCGPWIQTLYQRISLSLFALHRKRRLYSGFLFAGVAGFLTYAFLEPLFVPVGSEVALVFLDILTLNAALVGMALGVLLPLVFPGVCLGTSLALLGVALSGVWNVYLFPAVGATLSLLFAIASARYVNMRKRLVFRTSTWTVAHFPFLSWLVHAALARTLFSVWRPYWKRGRWLRVWG
jgi:hypothetical protein